MEVVHLDDIDTLPPFNPADWIGTGKQFTPALPQQVFAEKQRQLTIPEANLTHFPSSTLPIAQFIELRLPLQSTEIITTSTTLWFSKEPARDNIQVLLNRPVPSKEFLTTLDYAFGQAWLDGAQSVVDWRYNDGRERFPLWVISLWKKTGDIIEWQSLWKRSCRWLHVEKAKSKHENMSHLICRAEHALANLGWNVQLCYQRGAVSSSVLSGLLSTAWLNDEHINMMLEELAKTLADIPILASQIIIAPLAFTVQINGTAKNKSYTKQNAGLLYKYQQRIAAGIRRIYFPINVNGDHWIAGVVDIENQLVGYGDPLSGRCNTAGHNRLMRNVQNWLQFGVGIKCTNRGDCLEHGNQDDWFSCGMLLPNTISHAVFGDDIWVQHDAALDRIRWFLKLQVCTSAAEGVSPQVRSRNNSLHNRDVTYAPESDTTLRKTVIVEDFNFPNIPIPSPSEIRQGGIHARLAIESLLNPLIENENGEDSDSSMDSEISIHGAVSVDAESHKAMVSKEEDTTTLDVEGVGSESDSDTVNVDSPGHAIVARNIDIQSDGISANENKDITMEDTKTRAHAAHPLLISSLSQSSKKRPCTPSIIGDTTSPAGSDAKKRRKETQGMSKSALASRTLRESFRNGKLEMDEKKLANWKQKCRLKDANVEFDKKNISARHSKCGEFIKMKEPYDATRFNDHVKNCTPETRKKRPAAGMPSLWKWVAPTKDSSSSLGSTHTRVESKPDYPCPGLTELDNSRIPIYLRRTGFVGGGARALTDIAKDRFGHAFSELGVKKKQEVMDVQLHEHMWRNDHQGLRVFATKCKRQVPKPALNSRTRPCDECSALLLNKRFKAILRKPTPDDKDFIYTNHRYRSKNLGEIYARTIGLRQIIENPDSRSTPCVRYALGVLSGKYDNKVFVGLIHAMVAKLDRDERGVGMQNFRYAPAWDEFCHSIKISSPRAYRVLQEHLPARSERSFRMKESRQPRFSMEIGEQTFIDVVEHLTALNYTGPVGLSCDDTKLFTSMRLFWDAEKKAYFLVGGTDGPCRVANPDEVRAVLEDPNFHKATKIRLWCLTIPVPKTTPLIVAALPIPNSLGAPILLSYLENILDGLLRHKVSVISYACDGTEVERRVQRLLVAKAPKKIKHTIKGPYSSANINISIAVIRDQPICMIQDSKHALKTFRNNLFSGARLLTIGNHTAIFQRIRDMAFESGSPLYRRDVEKLDRQDDNAATRLFSADVLKYLSDHHPDYIGEITYLFVFGELIDAYQNRHISHVERLSMVMRARYFLDAWEIFLAHSGYTTAHYFLSREAVDIAHIIIEGYISLVLVHRDHLPVVLPLIPWLHSSEACEHVFGEARQIVKDFAYLDFIYMVPKLRVKLRQTILRALASDPKACASGYNHTYFDHTDVDLRALATFPTNEEIDELAGMAMQEVDSLLALVGIVPGQLHRLQDSTVVLPGITSLINIQQTEGMDGDLASILESEDDAESISEAQELQELVEHEEKNTLSRTRAQGNQIMNLTCAALALAADELMNVRGVSEIGDEELAMVVAEERQQMSTILRDLPKLQAPDEHTKPLGLGEISAVDLDFDPLVKMRRTHQTRQAAFGVRTRSHNTWDAASGNGSETSIKMRIVRQMHDVLKEQDEHAVGTGYERAARWGNSGKIETAGNAANAAAAAATVARRAATRRGTIFQKAGVPRLSDVKNACITILRPLRIGDYGVVFTDHGLRVAKVIAFYSKTGGKNGKHSSITESSNIGAISYIAAQLFEFMHGRQFRHTPEATARLQTRQFALLGSMGFLTIFSSRPRIHSMTGTLELSVEDTELFNALNHGATKFRDAMALSRKRNNEAEDSHEIEES